MAENSELFRKRLSITEEQNLLLQDEAERLGKTDSVVLKQIINLGFEAYFSKQNDKAEEGDSGHTADIEKIEEKLDDILKYSRQAAAISYGALAGFFYAEWPHASLQELLVKTFGDYKFDNFNAGKIIQGSGPNVMTFMFQKVGGYMSENGGDLMNAYYRFCETYKIDYRLLFKMKKEDWEQFKEPKKCRALSMYDSPPIRTEEQWSWKEKK